VSTHKNKHLTNNRLLVAQPVDLKGNAIGNTLIAQDVVDAGVGDQVLVMKEGGSARIALKKTEAPIQAVVVAIVDNLEVEES